MICNLFHIKLILFFLFVLVVVDYANDKTASTGEFELIHDCAIPKYSTYSRLSVEGKRVYPISKKIPLPKLTNFTDLIVEGNKLMRPLEIYENHPHLKFARNMIVRPSSSLEENVKRTPNTTTSKYMNCFKEHSEMSFKFIYSKRETSATRNMFKSITMRPCQDKLGYVKQLPPFLKSSGSKAFVNLNDLKKYLKDSLTCKNEGECEEEMKVQETDEVVGEIEDGEWKL